MSIPKIIHYCWFGKTKMPEMVVNCIQSWKHYLPDYEFVFWNEENTIFDNEFVKECYRLKKWAFVSDYIRLKALYEHGGVYLDTDMLLLRPLDEFLNNECFFGAESHDHISCGIIGALPRNLFIRDCLQSYQYLQIPKDNRWYTIAIPMIVTRIFEEKNNFKGHFKEIVSFKNVKIYPKVYFYAVPNLKRTILHSDLQNYITKDSYAVHLWQSSWMTPSEFNLINNHNYFKALKKIAITVFVEKKGSLTYYKKIMSCFWQSFKITK